MLDAIQKFSQDPVTFFIWVTPQGPGNDPSPLLKEILHGGWANIHFRLPLLVVFLCILMSCLISLQWKFTHTCDKWQLLLEDVTRHFYSWLYLIPHPLVIAIFTLRRNIAWGDCLLGLKHIPALPWPLAIAKSKSGKDCHCFNFFLCLFFCSPIFFALSRSFYSFSDIHSHKFFKLNKLHAVFRVLLMLLLCPACVKFFKPSFLIIQTFGCFLLYS